MKIIKYQLCTEVNHGTEDANADRCVCCGAVIPEGRQVCPICERQWPEF